MPYLEPTVDGTAPQYRHNNLRNIVFNHFNSSIVDT